MDRGGGSALFRFFLRFFLGLAQRHGLLESLADFVKAFFVEVVNALGALSTKVDPFVVLAHGVRSEEHTSELQSLMRNSYAVFCSEKKIKETNNISLNTLQLTYTSY